VYCHSFEKLNLVGWAQTLEHSGNLRKRTFKYMKADDRVAGFHLAISLGLFFGLWALGIAFWDVMIVRLVLMVVMAGG